MGVTDSAIHDNKFFEREAGIAGGLLTFYFLQ
jgi:hypothetical protein